VVLTNNFELLVSVPVLDPHHWIVPRGSEEVCETWSIDSHDFDSQDVIRGPQSVASWVLNALNGIATAPGTEDTSSRLRPDSRCPGVQMQI